MGGNAWIVDLAAGSVKGADLSRCIEGVQSNCLSLSRLRAQIRRVFHCADFPQRQGLTAKLREKPKCT
jgi:hypothetical protein